MSPVRVLGKNDTGGLEEMIRQLAGSSVIAAGGGLEPGRGESAGAVVDSVMRSFYGREARLIAHESGCGTDGLLVWSVLPWDTAITGIRCARISLFGGEGPDEMLAAWREEAMGEGVAYTTARIPAEGAFHDCQAESFARAGFTRLEETAYLSVPTFTVHEDPPDVEEAGPRDMEAIREIARRSFSFDRFHNEPLFSRDSADRVHEEWARNSFAGRADVVLVRKGPEGWPVGYCTVIIPDLKGASAAWIDMLAVRPGERRKGTGRKLMTGALFWLRQRGIGQAALCTQSDNLPALGLYRRMGFKEYAAAETWRYGAAGE